MRPRIELKKFVDPKDPVSKIAVREVVTCKEKSAIRDAIKLVLEDRKRRIPVVNSHFKGLVTVIDILDYLGGGSKGKRFRNLGNPVNRIMETSVPCFGEKETLGEVLRKIKIYRKGGYPILHEKQLVGFVSEFDFMKQVNKKTGIKVRDVMNRPFIARDYWPILDVAKMMCNGPYRRLPVVEKGILIGIMTPYDIIRYLDSKKRFEWFRSEKTLTRDVMVKRVVTVGPEKDVHDAVRIMKERNVGGLPVVEEQELLGIITERDVADILRT